MANATRTGKLQGDSRNGDSIAVSKSSTNNGDLNNSEVSSENTSN
jgi:hypothetical protein